MALGIIYHYRQGVKSAPVKTVYSCAILGEETFFLQSYLMRIRVAPLLLLLWSASASATAWKPLLPLKGQAAHVPFLADYLKDPSVFLIKSKKELARHEDALRAARKKNLQNTKLLRAYFVLLSEACYYRYQQRRSAQPARAEKSCHQELVKVGTKLLKSARTQRNKIIYNVALSLFNLQKYREAHKAFSKLLSKSFTNPLALKAGLAAYLIDLEIKKSISNIAWQRLLAKFDVRGKIIIHLATARHLAGLNLLGERERRASTRYRHYLQQLSPLLADVNSARQELVLTFVIGIISKSEDKINWQRFPVRIETFAYTNAFPALLERQALFAVSQQRFRAALSLYKRLLPMVKGRKTQQIVRRLLVIAKKFYNQTKDSKEYRRIMHLSSNYLKSDAEKKLLDKYIQFIINKESAQLQTMQAPRLKQTLILIKEMLRLQSTPAHIISSREKLARINLRLGNIAGAVSIYYMLFKTSGNKSLKYIDLAIKYQHQLAKWPVTVVWQEQPRQLRVARARLLKMYDQKTPLLMQKDWRIIAQRGLLALNLNMKNRAWGLWISNMQYTNKQITPIAIGIVLSDYLSSKQWLKAEMLIKRCLQFAVTPQTNGKRMPLGKIHIDVLDSVIKLHLRSNNLEAAKAKSIEFFKLFPTATRQPENLLRLADTMIKTKEYATAMSYLIKLINDYQSNDYFRRGLLLAASLAIRQGNEQKATVFYRLFFHRYPQDKAVRATVLQLVKLYDALRLYGDLQVMYRFIFSSPLFSGIEKQNTEIATMELEEKYGSSSKALSIAKKIIAQPQRDPRHKAIAASLLARYHHARKDLKALAALAGSLSSKRQEYRAVRNELAFYIAENQHFVNPKIVEKYEQKPVEFLKYLTNSFALVKKNYLDVCKFSTSRFCLAAYLSLVDRCLVYVDAANTAELSAASTRQAYDIFMQNRKRLTDYFESQKQLFRNSSVKELQKGNASFEWVAKTLVVLPELNLSYVNGYLSEPDFIQLDIDKDLKDVR